MPQLRPRNRPWFLRPAVYRTPRRNAASPARATARGGKPRKTRGKAGGKTARQARKPADELRVRSDGSGAGGFPAEHRLFAGKPPMIAGQRTRRSDHTVARHDKGNRVTADRSTHGPGRFGLADVGSDG